MGDMSIERRQVQLSHLLSHLHLDHARTRLNPFTPTAKMLNVI